MAELDEKPNPRAAARGCLFGSVLGLSVWAVLGLVVWLVLR